jgi:hypothetical protein
MHNLAKTYSALERNQEARVLKEKVLEFRRRTLPADHPMIGDSVRIEFATVEFIVTRAFGGFQAWQSVT